MAKIASTPTSDETSPLPLSTQQPTPLSPPAESLASVELPEPALAPPESFALESLVVPLWPELDVALEPPDAMVLPPSSLGADDPAIAPAPPAPEHLPSHSGRSK